MPGLALTLPTAYSDATAKFNTGSLKFEARKDTYGALAAFIRSSSGLLSNSQIQGQKHSFERPINIPVLKRMAISLIDGRLCDFDGTESATDKILLTFSTKGFRVKVPRTNMLRDNHFGAAELLANGLYHGWHKWFDFMETACVAYLEANKSTTLALATGYFGITAAAYTAIKGSAFYAAYEYALGLNMLSSAGDYLDVASGNAVVTRTLMNMNGANNSVNQASLIGGAELYPTNKVVPAGVGVTETHYVFPSGSVGIYNWLSPNAASNETFIPEQDFWFSESDPIFGYFPASVHYKAKCVDSLVGFASASEPVYYDIYEYTIDPSFVKSYTSVAGESPIVKFNLTDV